MARFPSIDETGAFEAPEVQSKIKELVTGTTDGITVDTSAGTRVFVGDTMIHGDTGWRDWSSLLHEDWEFNRRFHVRRENNIITLAVYITRASTAEPVAWLSNNISLLNTEGSVIPSGFRPYAEYNYFAYAQTIQGIPVALSAVSRMNDLKLRALGASSDLLLKPGMLLTFTSSWQTSDPWPTSLPGVPG